MVREGEAEPQRDGALKAERLHPLPTAEEAGRRTECVWRTDPPQRREARG